MLHTRNKNTSVPISHPSQHSTITKTHYQKPNNQSQQLRSESKDSKKIIIIKDKKEKERHTLLWEKKNGEWDEHRGSEWSFNLGAGGWYILVSFFYVFLFSFLLWIFFVVAVVVFCFFVLSLCFGFSKKRFRCGGMDHPRCFRKLRVFWDGWIVCHCRSIVIV